MKDQLSRRSFIKGAAVGAGSLAFLGAGITSAEALPTPKKWDEKADIVVAGGGGAGLSAAVWARKSGAKVICLEKAASPMASSTAVSAGGFAAAGTRSQKKENVKDSFDLLYKDIMSFTNNEADPAIAKMYSVQSLKGYEWLMDLGVPLVLLQLVESHSVAREHWLNASELMQRVEKDAKAQGVALHLNTAATNLIVNDKGRVIGVRAKSKKGDMNIMAKKAVILACGGFAANLPLCGEFGGPEFRTVETLGGKGNVGEGFLMALPLKAATKNMYGAVVNENLAIAENNGLSLQCPPLDADNLGPGCHDAFSHRGKVFCLQRNRREMALFRHDALDRHRDRRIGEAHQGTAVHEPGALRKIEKEGHRQHRFAVLRLDYIDVQQLLERRLADPTLHSKVVRPRQVLFSLLLHAPSFIKKFPVFYNNFNGCG